VGVKLRKKPVEVMHDDPELMADLIDVEFGGKTRVEIWTDQFIIVGDAHAPHSIRGTKRRLSDLLNDPTRPFLPITDVTVFSLQRRRLWRGEFLAVNKASVVLVKALKE
jgi:hypothetical protein